MHLFGIHCCFTIMLKLYQADKRVDSEHYRKSAKVNIVHYFCRNWGLCGGTDLGIQAELKWSCLHTASSFIFRPMRGNGKPREGYWQNKHCFTHCLLALHLMWWFVLTQGREEATSLQGQRFYNHSGQPAPMFNYPVSAKLQCITTDTMPTGLMLSVHTVLCFNHRVRWGCVVAEYILFKFYSLTHST